METKTEQTKVKPDKLLNLMMKDLKSNKNIQATQKKNKIASRIKKEKNKNEGYYDH